MRTVEFIEKVNLNLPKLFHVGNFKTELTLEALIHNEKIMNEMFLGKKALETTAIPFAVHLGNCLIKHIPGAKWVDEEMESPFDLTIVVPLTYTKDLNSFIKTFPMNRVLKFLNTNREFNLSSFLTSTIFMSNNDLNDPKFTQKADKDGWCDIGGNSAIRVFQVKKEDLPN